MRPRHTALLIGLLNTLHMPDGVDALVGSGPEVWISDGMVDGGRSLHAGRIPAPPVPRGGEGLRRLREGLRVLTRITEFEGSRHDPAVEAAAGVLRSHPVVLRFGDGSADRPTLIPAGDAADAEAVSIAAVADAYLRSCADSSFARVRTCATVDCQWGFWDSSRNRSRRWCSMNGCGNRAKNRAYRARRM